MPDTLRPPDSAVPEGIHHLTFVVRDLDASVRRWSVLLGPPRAFDALPGRNVRTARFDLGAAHIVLVQPLGAAGEPARVLREHGEGLLLVSLGVCDLDQALAEIETRGISREGPERAGLLGWRVQDLPRGFFDGVQLQLCQSAAGSEKGAG